MSPGLRRIDPPELGAAPYSHVLVAEPGSSLVFVSGQIAADAMGAIVGDDIETQAWKAFENVSVALRAAGAGWEHVVRLTTYLVDMDHLGAVREVRDAFFDPDRLPGSTLVEVSRLFRPECLIELDAIGCVPPSRSHAQ